MVNAFEMEFGSERKVGEVAKGIKNLERVLDLIGDGRFVLCVKGNDYYVENLYWLENLYWQPKGVLPGVLRQIKKEDYIKETKEFTSMTGKSISTGPKVSLDEYLANENCQALFDWYIGKFPEYCLRYSKKTNSLYVCKNYEK